MVGGGDAFIVGDTVLPDPRVALRLEPQNDSVALARFEGMVHGDLHLGNVLLEGQSTPDQFWLIDFALAKAGPLFYDQAYLECALLATFLPDTSPEHALSIMRSVPQSDFSGLQLADVGLAMCLGAVQSSLMRWAKNREPRRQDPFEAQLWLARIAAGLNWTNKPTSEADARIAAVYAAWAAHSFLDQFAPDALSAARSRVVSSTAVSGIRPTLPTAIDRSRLAALQASVWDSLSQFDERNGCYVLIASRSEKTHPALGALPWSLIIDLDPSSDENGLYAAVSQAIEQKRSLHSFGLHVPPLSFDRATLWLMAAGWTSHFEAPPGSLKEWRWKYPKIIRTVCENLRSATAPRRVKCLVLPGAGDQEILSPVVEALEESLQDQLDLIVLNAPATHASGGSPTATTELHTADFISGLANLLGDSLVASGAPEMPGARGPVELDISTLRNLEEDLELLHSDVLFETARTLRQGDQFWRGSPPSWIDLQAGLDVSREMLPELTERLERALSRRRNQTIELRHDPGSGGTTLARRVAWDLHRRHPTVLLRQVSEATVDRLDRLFHMLDRPILLVMDSAVASVATREQIYRGLLTRNASFVILYVGRQPARAGSRDLYLSDPMSDAEAREFAHVYSHQTDDQQKRLQLRKIASGDLAPPYESPFFFGLYTYERGFQKVESYVTAHLVEASTTIQRILTHLALVTRFTQIGLDEAFVGSWAGVEAPDLDLDLEQTIGQVPARLVVRADRNCRLLHPIIAEEVLRQTSDHSQWESGLHSLALEFIDAVMEVVSGDDDVANHLFSQLFIQRQAVGESSVGNFAAVIGAMREPAGAVAVLTRLTEARPADAHFWNHLGRYLAYVMKVDYEKAETCLLKAVALTQEQDPINLHTLGQVRRLWLERKITELFRAPIPPKPSDVLDEADDLFDAAAGAFARARALQPDGEYPYVTAIQLTLFMADALRRAAGEISLSSLMVGESRASQWLREHLPEAEDLYAGLDHNRGQGAPSRYALDVQRRLFAAFDDYDSLIAAWEPASYGSAEPELRRALSAAYLGRAGRSWERVPHAELARIVDMMDSNLREHSGINRDVRTWFDAYRRLPEFSLIAALERIGGWAARSDDLDAHYYAYVIHFLMHHAGLEFEDQRMRFHMQRSKELAAMRAARQFGYEWLGRGLAGCPLVNHRELGPWNSTMNFFEGPVDNLARVTGVVERIDSPQSGYVALREGVRAFFPPGQDLRKSHHVGALVNVLVGFSYEGLRAWDVQPGPALGEDPLDDQKNREAGENADAMPTKRSSPVPQGASEAEPRITEVKLADLDQELFAEVAAATKRLVRERHTLGPTRPKHLTPLLLTEFPGLPVHRRLGFSSLREMLAAVDGIILSEDGTVRLAGADAD
jgi:hypothetical protein